MTVIVKPVKEPFYINYVICNLYDLVILDKESSVLY